MFEKRRWETRHGPSPFGLFRACATVYFLCMRVREHANKKLAYYKRLFQDRAFRVWINRHVGDARPPTAACLPTTVLILLLFRQNSSWNASQIYQHKEKKAQQKYFQINLSFYNFSITQLIFSQIYAVNPERCAFALRPKITPKLTWVHSDLTKTIISPVFRGSSASVASEHGGVPSDGSFIGHFQPVSNKSI